MASRVPTNLFAPPNEITPRAYLRCLGDDLTPEQRLAGLTPEQVLARYSPEQIINALSSEVLEAIRGMKS